MKRNKFSLSYYNLLSCNMGGLVPIGLTEVLPGDSFQHSTSALIRLSPLLAPVMHPLHVRIHHWFVPHRLVWDSWEDFITGGPDGEDDSAFPTIAPGSFGPGSIVPVGSLADYYGIPTGAALSTSVSALPFRGYSLIFNEWYRDQDLMALRALSTADGVDSITPPTSLSNVAWEKSYYSMARPWEDKGPDIMIPLTGDGAITRVPNAGKWRAFDNGTNTAADSIDIATDAIGDLTDNVSSGLSLDPRGGLELDPSNVGVNPLDLRLGGALLRYQEARALYGSRYTEYLRYLGVRSSDARLQRPEYLGGGKQTIQFSEILQTAPGDGDENDVVGALKGHGIGSLRSNRYRRFFEEHGYIHSFISVRPKEIYAQGIDRTWNRRTKEDFWQREFELIGQQEILNKEVYGLHASPNGTFGWIPRYEEYRFQPSRVTGQFRTSTLDYWNMARIFSSAPSLNEEFVTCTPTERIFADNANDVLWIMANHSIQARRLVGNGQKSARIM